MVLFILNKTLDDYKLRILNLCGIYIILGLSMNLINGFTGLFSLGHAGFMAIGAYTVAILTMPVAMKDMNFFMKPIVPFFSQCGMELSPSPFNGWNNGRIIWILIGAPVLRLTDDYLAIATLGLLK